MTEDIVMALCKQKLFLLEEQERTGNTPDTQLVYFTGEAVFEILDLIQRLQDENAGLKERGEIVINSLHETIDTQKAEIERLAKVEMDLIGKIAEQKTEIERLTEYCGMFERGEIGSPITTDKMLALEKEKIELQKQVDELKEQLKSVQSACQSKNGKIKTLNSEKEALQNELNFQNEKPHYRYVIWNTKQNKRQFPSICELTESGAYTKLFQKIGWDSAKYRFEVRRIKVDGVEVE